MGRFMENRETTLIGCFVYLVLLVFFVLVNGFCTEYLVEFWANYFGKPVDIPYPVACLGFFIGPITIILAIITYILSFIL